MWHYLDRLLNLVSREIGHLEPEHWLMLGALTILLGLIWLRGFGSRRNY